MAAREVISLFGGIRPMARWMGHGNPSTVQGWAERGVIPLRQIPYVIDAARRAKIKVSVRNMLPRIPKKGERA